MQEKAIEEYLRDKVKAAGGRAYKFVSPGNRGVPDRIILLPGARIIFTELKAQGKHPTPIQKLQHEKIRKLGFEVLIIDNKATVDELISRESKSLSERKPAMINEDFEKAISDMEQNTGRYKRR